MGRQGGWGGRQDTGRVQGGSWHYRQGQSGGQAGEAGCRSALDRKAGRQRNLESDKTFRCVYPKQPGPPHPKNIVQYIQYEKYQLGAT
jgi:hypothetical protein